MCRYGTFAFFFNILNIFKIVMWRTKDITGIYYIHIVYYIFAHLVRNPGYVTATLVVCCGSATVCRCLKCSWRVSVGVLNLKSWCGQSDQMYYSRFFEWERHLIIKATIDRSTLLCNMLMERRELWNLINRTTTLARKCKWLIKNS